MSCSLWLLLLMAFNELSIPFKTRDMTYYSDGYVLKLLKALVNIYASNHRTFSQLPWRHKELSRVRPKIKQTYVIDSPLCRYALVPTTLDGFVLRSSDHD